MSELYIIFFLLICEALYGIFWAVNFKFFICLCGRTRCKTWRPLNSYPQPLTSVNKPPTSPIFYSSSSSVSFKSVHVCADNEIKIRFVYAVPLCLWPNGCVWAISSCRYEVQYGAALQKDGRLSSGARSRELGLGVGSLKMLSVCSGVTDHVLPKHLRPSSSYRQRPSEYPHLSSNGRTRLYPIIQYSLFMKFKLVKPISVQLSLDRSRQYMSNCLWLVLARQYLSNCHGEALPHQYLSNRLGQVMTYQ